MAEFTQHITEEPLPREPLDYRTLLLGQLRGISAFTTTSTSIELSAYLGQYAAAVDFLITLLLPFQDDAIKAELGTIDKEQAEAHRRYGFEYANRPENFLLLFPTRRLRCAVLLMHRKGLLVKQAVGEEIEADDAPDVPAEQLKVVE